MKAADYRVVEWATEGGMRQWAVFKFVSRHATHQQAVDHAKNLAESSWRSVSWPNLTGEDGFIDYMPENADRETRNEAKASS
jgi:hypothetical protein